MTQLEDDEAYVELLRTAIAFKLAIARLTTQDEWQHMCVAVNDLLKNASDVWRARLDKRG